MKLDENGRFDDNVNMINGSELHRELYKLCICDRPKKDLIWPVWLMF